jgi:hypothetical protein
MFVLLFRVGISVKQQSCKLIVGPWRSLLSIVNHRDGANLDEIIG